MEAGGPPIVGTTISHFYGSGELRKQILCDVDVSVRAGEIVIVTGPSGSGKSTLLTLIGALRSAQHGSLCVLGEELRDARPATLEGVRKQIGYIFQHHNLIDALSALQNVEMALYLHPWKSRSEVRERAGEMLAAVGLGERMNHHPSQLSGGQRQRVAIARALVAHPRIILADEPTASLDKQSGREVVDRMQTLAREQGVTVLMVTHDNRVLDIADRIIHLEDGRLSSFTDAVIANARHMMGVLAESHRKGELPRRVAEMSVDEFRASVDHLTAEARRFLEATELANDEAFRGMLDEMLFAFTMKMEELFDSERASLFLVDSERNELWLRFAHDESDKPIDFRIPIGSGIAGSVAATGEGVRIDDAYSDPRFHRGIDEELAFHTRGVLCLPIHGAEGRVFAVAQLLNRRDGKPFDAADETRFGDFLGSIAVILGTWWADARARREQMR